MEESDMKRCGQCGELVAASEMTIDEESGLLLCPQCAREQESCGCSDEVD